MFRAVWNGAVLAESERTIKVEGNHYFPPGSLRREYFTASPTTSTLPVEGPGPLLPRQRGRHGQPGRGLVLPAAQRGGEQDRRAHRVLARGAGRARARPGRGSGGRGEPWPGRPGPRRAAPDRGVIVTSATGAPGVVRVYWRPGCPYCAMLRLGLRRSRLPVEEINIWEDRAAAAAVRAITGGDETVPTVVVGTKAMVNPSARQVIVAVR